MQLSDIYDNSVVRRQDRLLGYERAMELLASAEYGFMALGGAEGYGLPINFVLVGGTIYFHCAPEGEKLRRIEACSRGSFCVVGHTCPLPGQFTTEYESVFAVGEYRIVTDDAERQRALEALVAKYSPDFTEVGHKYIQKSFHRTAVVALSIERLSGKTKRVK